MNAKKSSPSTIKPQTETARARRYLDLVERTRSMSKAANRSEADVRALIAEKKAAADGAATSIGRLDALKEVEDLQKELALILDNETIDVAEAEFVEIAKGWAERKGYSRAVLLSFGISKEVLTKAGIS